MAAKLKRTRATRHDRQLGFPNPMTSTVTKRHNRASLQVAQEKKTYWFRLFISGTTSKSTQAVKCAKRFCDEFFQDRYNLEIIDIFQQPELGDEDNIIAVPTLVKKAPSPVRKCSGDLADIHSVLKKLQLA